MYTIQSTRNNRYIGSLFSDGHQATFTERESWQAYAWNSKEAAVKIALEYDQCKVVEIILENN